LFLSEVFFAVFPLHPANRVRFGDISESLRRFKEFLDSRQHDVSQAAEFLPYYALPYLPNPSEHPSFSQLFSREWFEDLRSRLSEWLDRQISPDQIPRLVTALRAPGGLMVSTDAELSSAVLALVIANKPTTRSTCEIPQSNWKIRQTTSQIGWETPPSWGDLPSWGQAAASGSQSGWGGSGGAGQTSAGGWGSPSGWGNSGAAGQTSASGWGTGIAWGNSGGH
jgi:hypothetical protein